MTDLPYYNELAIAVRTVLYGPYNAMVLHMRARNLKKLREAARG
jgi:hypothetical protein